MNFLGDFTTKADTVGGSIWWTGAVALIPILYFFWALAIRKMKGDLCKADINLVY